MTPLLLASSVVLSASGNMLFKAGMLTIIPYAASGLGPLAYGLYVISRPQVIVGILCYIGTFGTWLSVLSRLELSVAYPIFVSAAFTVVTLGAMLFFHENITPLRIIGMVVVFIGICLVYSTR